MTWTREQIDAEWRYIYDERIALMIGSDGFASEEIQRIAREDADKHIAQLKNER